MNRHMGAFDWGSLIGGAISAGGQVWTSQINKASGETLAKYQARIAEAGTAARMAEADAQRYGAGASAAIAGSETTRWVMFGLVALAGVGLYLYMNKKPGKAN